MAVIGTAGHVDHGKSALVERLTGIDPDRFEEEKRRGLTIDLGFAWLTLPSGREVGIVDVPGHERFIRNMLAGAGGLSACLFVVAANEGWKPQSAEHLAIVDTLGIEHGVVALTKSDLVNEERLGSVRADIEGRLAVTSMRNVRIVACSSVTGDGLDELKEALDRALETAGPATNDDRPRLWVDRVFTIKGAGTVVTGTLAGGGLQEGDEVELSPDGVKARIRSIQSHKRRVSQIEPANRVALNLAGLERAQVERGDAIVRPKGWRPTRRVDALVKVLPAWATGGTDHSLTARGSHLLYVGSAEVPVRVRLLDRRKVGGGETGLARLTLRDPLPLARGDRFVLRDAGRVLTFGGGEILDPLPGDADVDLLTALIDASVDEALQAIVDAEGAVDRDEALLRSGLLEVPSDVIELATTLVSRTHLEDLQDRLRRTVDAYHAAHPIEAGMPKESARAELHLDDSHFETLIRETADVIDEGRFVRRESHRVELSAEQSRQRDELMAQLAASGFTPPLESELNVDAALLRSLVEAGDLVKVANFYLSRDLALTAQRKARDLIEQKGPATVAQLRDLLGTTRKYAVPLCEWLDASAITVRRGDVRVLGPRAASLPR